MKRKEKLTGKLRVVDVLWKGKSELIFSSETIFQYQPLDNGWCICIGPKFDSSTHDDGCLRTIWVDKDNPIDMCEGEEIIFSQPCMDNGDLYGWFFLLGPKLIDKSMNQLETIEKFQQEVIVEEETG